MMASFGLLALAVAAVPAQDDTGRDRFELFNNCEPMHLLVLDLYDDAAEIVLTKERLRFTAESRLRGARLFKADLGTPFLQVRVSVTSRAHVVDLTYHKTLFDPVSGRNGFAATWNDGSFGTHGGEAEFILSSLSARLDKFLTQYLRVNESACTERPVAADPVSPPA